MTKILDIRKYLENWKIFLIFYIKLLLLFCFVIRNVVREKNGIMWEKFPSGGPPPPTPPVWEFSHFFTVFVKLVMPFYKLLNWKKTVKNMEWVWVRPPP